MCVCGEREGVCVCNLPRKQCVSVSVYEAARDAAEIQGLGHTFENHRFHVNTIWVTRI